MDGPRRKLLALTPAAAVLALMLGGALLQPGAGAQTLAARPLLAGVDADIAGPERVDLTALIFDTREILLSDAFRTNLLAFRQFDPASGGERTSVWMSQSLGYRTVSQLAEMLTAAGGPWRYAYSHVQATGGATHEKVMTGSDPVEWSRPLIQLGRRHLARYRSANAVERSCAINSLAHEFAHTVTDQPLVYLQAIKDSGPDQAPSLAPQVAGYLAGSVAQCTYLQRIGRIGATGLQACVAAFGTAEFRSDRCGLYDSAEPVAWPRR